MQTKLHAHQDWGKRTETPTRDWARPALTYLLQRHGPAMTFHEDRGSGCSRRGKHSMWHQSSWWRSPLAPHRVTEQTTHKLENNYTKEVLALLQKFYAYNQFPNLGIRQKDWESPRKQTLGGHNKTLCAPRPRRKEQWPHKRLSQTCLWVSSSLRQRCESTVECHGVRGMTTTVLGVTACWHKSFRRRSPLTLP